jgi:hypothetical protein
MCPQYAGNRCAYVSIRQHTSAYVSIRQRTTTNTTTDVSSIRRQSLLIRQHTSAYVSIRQRTTTNTTIYVSSIRRQSLLIRQHTSAYVSIRQHTSAYVSVLLLILLLMCSQYAGNRCCLSIQWADVFLSILVPGLEYFSTSCWIWTLSRCALIALGGRMLTYADVCWRMLAYAGVCWLQGAPLLP